MEAIPIRVDRVFRNDVTVSLPCPVPECLQHLHTLGKMFPDAKCSPACQLPFTHSVAQGDRYQATLCIMHQQGGKYHCVVAKAELIEKVSQTDILIGTIVLPEGTRDERSQKFYITSPFFNSAELSRYNYDSSHYALGFPSNLAYGEFDHLAGGEVVEFQATLEPGRRWANVMWARILSNDEAYSMEMPHKLPLISAANSIADFWLVALNAEKQKTKEDARLNKADDITLSWNSCNSVSITAKFKFFTPKADSSTRFRLSIGEEVKCTPRNGCPFHGFILDVDISTTECTDVNPIVVTLGFSLDTAVHLLTQNQPSKETKYCVEKAWNKNAYKLMEHVVDQYLRKSLSGNCSERKLHILKQLTAIEQDTEPVPNMLDSSLDLTAPGIPVMDSKGHREAVKMILKENRPLVMVEGAPGSGKSTFSAGLVNKLLSEDPELKILVCAPSNRAADHIGDILYKIQQSGESAIRVSRHYPKDAVFRGQELCTEFCPSAMAQHPTARDTDHIHSLREILLKKKQRSEQIQVPDQRRGEVLNEINQLAKEIKKLTNELTVLCEWVLNPNVVVTTASHAAAEGASNPQLCYSHVIFDEAGQASQPEIMGAALQLKDDPHAQLFMVGDRHQLPPPGQVVGFIGERLQNSIMAKLEDQRAIPLVKLGVTFRMHPEILTFPAKYIYGNQLQTPVRNDDRALLLKKFPFPKLHCPIVFIGHLVEESIAAGRSVFNVHETQVVCTIVQYLLAVSKVNLDQIAILTFYEAQRISVAIALQKQLGIKATPNLLANVDSFQGQEKDIVIISCSRSHNPDEGRKATVGFLRDYRRVNVATTRPRHGLILTGNPSTLSLDPFWQSLLCHLGSQNLVHMYFDQVLANYPSTDAVAAAYDGNGHLNEVAQGLFSDI